MDMVNKKDYNVTSMFTEEKGPPRSPLEYGKKRSDRMETEQFYFEVYTTLIVPLCCDDIFDNLILPCVILVLCIHVL